MVDIIVRAKDGHALTRECLLSIKANTPPGTYRIILVDDGSDPELGTNLTDIYVRTRYSNGAVTATNLGVAISLCQKDSEYTLILDNDTKIPDGDQNWLKRFVAELEAGGSVTACVGATSNCVNPPQHILSVPQTYLANWERGSAENPPVVWFVSFAVLFRKSALVALGPWDERYNPGNWEDTDYAMALRCAGYQIRVARSVYIHHRGHQTFRKDLKDLLITNGAKFQDKWGAGRLFDMGFLGKDQFAEALK